MSSFIQVAGVIDATEARLLIDCGVHYLGFPLKLSVHYTIVNGGITFEGQKCTGALPSEMLCSYEQGA